MKTKTIEVVLDSTTSVPRKKRNKTDETFQFLLAYQQADQNIRRVIKNQLKEHKLTLLDWLLLNILKQGPEEGLSMGAIAETLHISFPQTTTVITKLIKLRLVRQKTQRSDRRLRHIIISARGDALRKNVSTEVKNTVQELLKHVPENYFVFYKKTLEQMAKQ